MLDMAMWILRGRLNGQREYLENSIAYLALLTTEKLRDRRANVELGEDLPIPAGCDWRCPSST